MVILHGHAREWMSNAGGVLDDVTVTREEAERGVTHQAMDLARYGSQVSVPLERIAHQGVEAFRAVTMDHIFRHRTMYFDKLREVERELGHRHYVVNTYITEDCVTTSLRSDPLTGMCRSQAIVTYGMHVYEVAPEYVPPTRPMAEPWGTDGGVNIVDLYVPEYDFRANNGTDTGELNVYLARAIEQSFRHSGTTSGGNRAQEGWWRYSFEQRKQEPEVWTCYIVECSDGTYYTGITNNVERRLRQHNGEIKGGAKYTAPRRPVRLLHSWEHDTKSDALKHEYQIKKMSRRQKEAYIKVGKVTRVSLLDL
jgi:putative endonuclease